MSGDLVTVRRPAGAPGPLWPRNRAGVTVVSLLALLTVAVAVRLYGVTYHSLWFDEVMSAYWAARPAAQIWQVGLSLVQDKHPPFYYLLLHFWTALFGPGDVAVRTLGVLLGALAVLPAYGIGRALGSRRAAALAALFLAINPFLVWYSQEARMFMPATTFVLVGLYGTLLLWRPRSSRASAQGARAESSDGRGDGIGQPVVAAVLVVAGFTAALYSYLFSALMLPVAGVWVLLLWSKAARTEERSAGSALRLITSLIALALVTLLFLPLARAAWSVSGLESLPGQAFEGVMPALGRLLEVYAFGWPAWTSVAKTAALLVVALLTLAGLVLPVTENAPVGIGRWSGGVLLAVWLLLPVGLGGLLMTRDKTVFGETRYFIFLVPALCLAWGRTLAWVWERCRPAGLMSLALACGLTLAVLPGDWSPQNRREAWREAAALIEAQSGPNDAVLVQPDYVSPALTRYLRDRLPVYAPFTDRIDDPAQLQDKLGALEGYDAVWLVQSHHQELDPDGLLVDWYASRFPLITEAFPAGVAVHAFAQHYRSPELAEVPVGVAPLGEDFGRLRLVGCVAQPTSLQARDELYHPPSGWVHVTTYWMATAPPDEDLYPEIRLVDAVGQVWGEHLERSGEAIRMWPTSRWQPGELLRADDDVNLNPITPPDRYEVVITVPGIETRASCGDVTVKR